MSPSDFLPVPFSRSEEPIGQMLSCFFGGFPGGVDSPYFIYIRGIDQDVDVHDGIHPSPVIVVDPRRFELPTRLRIRGTLPTELRAQDVADAWRQSDSNRRPSLCKSDTLPGRAMSPCSWSVAGGAPMHRLSCCPQRASRLRAHDMTRTHSSALRERRSSTRASWAWERQPQRQYAWEADVPAPAVCRGYL